MSGSCKGVARKLKGISIDNHTVSLDSSHQYIHTFRGPHTHTYILLINTFRGPQTDTYILLIHTLRGPSMAPNMLPMPMAYHAIPRKVA
jgi:hypothetical protein